MPPLTITPEVDRLNAAIAKASEQGLPADERRMAVVAPASPVAQLVQRHRALVAAGALAIGCGIGCLAGHLLATAATAFGAAFLS
jgi:Na+(H+)/acetate symporter ActP